MVSITIGTSDLRAALSSVRVHASNDGDYPTLRRIRLQVDPVNVTISTTDRFTIALAIVSVLEQPSPDAYTIDLLPDDVSKILTIFKAGKEAVGEDGPEYLIRIDSSDDHILVTDCSGMIDGRALKLPRLPFDDQYPDIPMMMSRAHHADPSLLEDMLVTGELLARFKIAATAYGAPLLIEARQGWKGLLIRCGESFLGMLAPRGSTEDEVFQRKEWAVAWSTRLPDPTPPVEGNDQ